MDNCKFEIDKFFENEKSYLGDVSILSTLVYLHILPNGKKYYGVTRQKVNNRWLKGKGYIKNKVFYNDIQKYGWENIKHIIIYPYTNIYVANFIEYSYIIRDKTYLSENGYNHEDVDINYFIEHYAPKEEQRKALDHMLNIIANTSIEELRKLTN